MPYDARMSSRHVVVFGLALALAACGTSGEGPPDGSTPDASPDATKDSAVDATTDSSVADAGVDADAQAALGWHDLTQASSWSTFDMTGWNGFAGGFIGAAFDGRYLYFVPHYDTNYDGVVARYDTQASFSSAGSWSVFDAGTVGARGFAGASFDGRYVYFVPFIDGVVARYDTQAGFATKASWSTFDVTTVNANAKQFFGSTFDGRYVYLVPDEVGNAPSGLVARYDTQATFGTAASWTTFDTTSVNANAAGFEGAVFDGRYVYLVPHDGSVVARCDTQASFTASGSWTAFDTTTVDPRATHFQDGAFDGRYVYFVPYDGATSGLVTRYDTQAGFAAAGSWSTFDTTTVNASAKGFSSAAFDGRYVYFVPLQNGAHDGVLARYDTTAAFGAGASWSTFDTTTVDQHAEFFWGAAFDGRYLYLVPYNYSPLDAVVARFDARLPPAMPTLPSWHGSFL